MHRTAGVERLAGWVRGAPTSLLLRVAAGLAGACLFLPVAGAHSDGAEGRLAAAFTAIDRALASSSMPAVTIGITDRERLKKVIVHGYADLKARTPLTAQSRFAVGSISKSFTAVALMELADEGRFDSHAPITRYLPWFEVNSPFPPIEGHHLLSHTAGLPNYIVDASSSRFAGIKLREFAPTYAPGAHWSYSNTGFQILGYALEDIEAAPYGSIIQRRVLDALGMTASAAVIDDAQRAKMVVSYTPWPYDGTYVEAPWFEYTAGDGSIVSNAEDMCAYVRFLLNRGVTPARRILSETAFRMLTTPVLEDYAYGLHIRKDDSGTVIEHYGSIYGFHALIQAHMDAGFGIVFLTSGGIDDSLQKWIVAVVAAAYRGSPLPALPPHEGDRKMLDPGQYVGTYHAVDGSRGRDGAALEFVVSGAHLALRTGTVVTPLIRMGADAYRMPASGPDEFPFLFARADGKSDGKVVGVSHGTEWLENGEAPPGATQGVAEVDHASYAAYVGHYENHGPEGPTARVFVRKARLMIAIGELGDETLVVPLDPVGTGRFRVAEPAYSPETATFDAIIEGRALRLNLTGVPLYRMDTP